MSKHVPPPTGEPLEGFGGLAAAVSPAWHQAIVRLANASERVANKLGWIVEHEQDDDPASEYVKNCRELVDLMLEFLDGLEDDHDLEETADDEPSLGWSTGGLNNGHCGGIEDLELDDCDLESTNDDEPSLGWTTSGGTASAPPGFLDAELDESDMEDGADSEPSLGWGVDGETGNESGGDRELAAQPSPATMKKARGRYSRFRDHSPNRDGKHVDSEHGLADRRRLRNLSDQQKELVKPKIDSEKVTLT